MQRSDSLELLNATHEFPCRFTLKVIGNNSTSFVEQIVQAVRLGDHIDDDFPYHTRETPNGRHISVTLEPTLSSAEDVLAIYERIALIEGVVMTM